MNDSATDGINARFAFSFVLLLQVKRDDTVGDAMTRFLL
jgi:hypothetical protein